MKGAPVPVPVVSRHAARRRTIVCAAMTALVPVLAFGARCVRDGHSFIVFPDAQVQTYAWMQKLAVSLHDGRLPLWDGNTLCGHPIGGALIAGVLYPLNIAWALVFGSTSGISSRALDCLVLLHFAIAALGMFVLLRRWSLDVASSCFGSVVFSCLGPLALRACAQPDVFYGLSWLPWALWALTRHFARRRAVDALLAGAFVGLQVLAGHAQPAFHTALLLAVATFALGTGIATRERWRASVRAALLAGAGLAVVAGPQLVLFLQYIGDAYRWVSAPEPIGPGARVDFEIFAYRHMLEPHAFLSLLDPWGEGVDDANTLYAGTVVVLLVAWFLASRRARRAVRAFRRHGRWLLAVAAAAVVCVLGHHTFVSAVLRVLPLTGHVRELGRYVILFHFAMSVIAAMGFRALVRGALEPPPRRSVAFWFLLVLLVLQLAWMAAGPSPSMSRTAVVQLLVAMVPAVAWFFPPAHDVLPALVGVALAVHVVAFGDLVLHRPPPGQRAEERFAGTEVSAALEHGHGRYRVDVRPDAPIPKNYADAHRFQEKLGHGATMYRPFFDFIARDWSEDSLVNDLLNVRYLLTGGPRALPLVAEDPERGLKLYERAHWYPRLFLRSQIGAQRPDGAALERAIGLTVERYDDEVQRFRFVVAAPDTAIASELVYPGWCATVNGKPVAIDRASIGELQTPLRAVPVGAGENVVEFRYRPFGALLFGCG